MRTQRSFEQLAEPIDIGPVRLRNRMMKNGTGFFCEDPATGGFMNDKYIDYYETLARAARPSPRPPCSRCSTRGPGRAGGSSATSTWTAGAAGQDAVERHDCLGSFQLFHEYGPQSVEKRTRLFVQMIGEIKRRASSSPARSKRRARKPWRFAASSTRGSTTRAAGTARTSDVYFYPDPPSTSTRWWRRTAPARRPTSRSPARSDDVRPCISCMTCSTAGSASSQWYAG
jgi:hypothetical protein